MFAKTKRIRWILLVLGLGILSGCMQPTYPPTSQGPTPLGDVLQNTTPADHSDRVP